MMKCAFVVVALTCSPTVSRAHTQTKPSRAAQQSLDKLPTASASKHAGENTSAMQPIPSIAALMRDLLANQDTIDRMRENYACDDRRTIEKLGRHGRVKKTETDVLQISFVGPMEIQRLIEKDGTPLSAKELRKEDKRITKEVSKYEKDKNKSSGERKKQQAAVRIQSFLRADRFYNPRREERAGERLIVFDFERNPNYKAKTLAEKLAQALVGTIWIDAKAHEVAQLEAHLAKNVKIGGGLVASLHKGSEAKFVQAFVGKQVWLPTYDSVHISARALLFFGVNEDQTDVYSAYRKFSVATHSKIARPKMQ